MKLTKKLILFVLCLLIACVNWLSFSVPVRAAKESKALYIALGDSIASGYGLESYINGDEKNKYSSSNSVTKLGKKLSMKTLNYGVEGMDSTVFYQALSKPATKEQKEAVANIKDAKLITISIGGNNVFIPLLNAVNQNIENGRNIFNADASQIQRAVLKLLLSENEFKNMIDNVLKGAETFTGNAKLHKPGDFENIISVIKALNPKAKLVVQTIYSPYQQILPDTIDDTIKNMNAKIIKLSDNGKNFRVADVYSAFAKAPGGLQLTNADTGKNFDPHPTQKGHEVIYTVMDYAAENKIPFEVKANVIKGRYENSVAAGELKIKIVPAAGCKLPKTIILTVGKSVKYTLPLNNGSAAIPIAQINGDLAITAVCTK